ncbi:TetR/AcrR family transcriptional regulator [Hyphomicrobium sp. 99]|uniref:TetR/AcrR family transcriptional regulator n=1 Tax=Hyphomicrobium sp. 99 TaxID=1163419 RepID=UPI0009E37A64|nr:TetR/AcrR family transcriptional regulator [Hyphomicrobium sp. 99]
MAQRTRTKKASGDRDQKPVGRAEPQKRRRLDPEDREREIIDGAVAFFAEVGFDGGLRDLAERLGITHQNLFRYFATKEALIERVYKEVYLNRWQREWETLLRNPLRPLEQRLIDFYQAYFPAIYRYDWVRIFVYAGLKNVGITKRYLDFIQKKVIEPLGYELRRVAGFPEEANRPLSPNELEIAWSLHGELFYLAIRKWVYDMPAPDDLRPVIQSAVARFLDGAPAALRNLRERAHSG